jgi:hypothetical protein
MVEPSPRIETVDLEKQKNERSPRVTFGWKDVSFSVDTKLGRKQILQNVSGFVKPGISLGSAC